MKVILILILLSGLAQSCAGLEKVSAQKISCREHEIVVTHEKNTWNGRSWLAYCRGQKYFCTSVKGSSKPQDVTCSLEQN